MADQTTETAEQKAAREKAAADAASDSSKKGGKGGTKKVRVLTETRHNGKTLKHNSIVEMTDAEIKAQDGAVDAHPDAVAYAEKLAPAKPASDVAL